VSHTSTDEGRGDDARGSGAVTARPFRRAFAATVTLLVVLCSVFLVLGYLQGAKLSSGQVDPEMVVAQSGQQLRLFANQSIANVTTGQVSVTPATKVTASSQGADIAVQFSDRLDYDTSYTVTIKNVRSLYGQRSTTFRYSFTTAAASLYYLDRAAPGATASGADDPLDTIVQTSLTGRSEKVLYSARHIQSFAPFPGALAVVTLNDDNTSSLSLVSLRGGGVENVLLPGNGVIDNIQSDSEAGVLQFTFTSAGPAAGRQYSNTLMSVDFNTTHTVQPVLGMNSASSPAVPPSGTADPVLSLAKGHSTTFDVSLVLDDGQKSRILYEIPGDLGSIDSYSISPNAQYVAIEEIPDVSASVSDGYFRDARSTSVATVIVDIATGEMVRIVDGFDVTWQ
jgi:hypothetical protein